MAASGRSVRIGWRGPSSVVSLITNRPQVVDMVWGPGSAAAGSGGGSGRGPRWGSGGLTHVLRRLLGVVGHALEPWPVSRCSVHGLRRRGRLSRVFTRAPAGRLAHGRRRPTPVGPAPTASFTRVVEEPRRSTKASDRGQAPSAYWPCRKLTAPDSSSTHKPSSHTAYRRGRSPLLSVAAPPPSPSVKTRRRGRPRLHEAAWYVKAHRRVESRSPSHASCRHGVAWRIPGLSGEPLERVSCPAWSRRGSPRDGQVLAPIRLLLPFRGWPHTVPLRPRRDLAVWHSMRSLARPLGTFCVKPWWNTAMGRRSRLGRSRK